MVKYTNTILVLFATVASLASARQNNLRAAGRNLSHDSNNHYLTDTPVPTPAPVAAVESNSLLTMPIASLCPVTEIPRHLAEDQDFNNGRWDGWTNGNSEQSERDTFTFFMRYEQGDHYPFRNFLIPFSSQRALFAFDFYEIDSWDGVGANGPDAVGITIAGDEGIVESINFGGYDYRIEEMGRSGTSDNGVEWQVVSDTFANSPQGFLDFQDQRHRVIVEVPSNFYSDNGQGTLTLTLQWTLNGDVDESIGFDNFSAVACEDTTPSTEPSASPSMMPSMNPTVDPPFSSRARPAPAPAPELPEVN